MRLLNYEGLKAKGIPFSRAHVWRLCADDGSDFPRPVKIGGGGRNMWVEAEIDAYIERKIAERDREVA